MQASGQNKDPLIETDTDTHHLYDSLQKNVTLTKNTQKMTKMLCWRKDESVNNYQQFPKILEVFKNTCCAEIKKETKILKIPLIVIVLAAQKPLFCLEVS